MRRRLAARVAIPLYERPTAMELTAADAVVLRIVPTLRFTPQFAVGWSGGWSTSWAATCACGSRRSSTSRSSRPVNASSSSHTWVDPETDVRSGGGMIP